MLALGQRAYFLLEFPYAFFLLARDRNALGRRHYTLKLGLFYFELCYSVELFFLEGFFFSCYTEQIVIVARQHILLICLLDIHLHKLTCYFLTLILVLCAFRFGIRKQRRIFRLLFGGQLFERVNGVELVFYIAYGNLYDFVLVRALRNLLLQAFGYLGGLRSLLLVYSNLYAYGRNFRIQFLYSTFRVVYFLLALVSAIYKRGQALFSSLKIGADILYLFFLRQ